jgi:hypothetical protein
VAPFLIVPLPCLLVFGVLALICWGIYRFRDVVWPVAAVAVIGTFAYVDCWPIIEGWLPADIWDHPQKYYIYPSAVGRFCGVRTRCGAIGTTFSPCASRRMNKGGE